MKNLVTIILLLILPVVVSAQSDQNQLDSLHVSLKNAANDTVRMDVYKNLGQFYMEINRDSAISYLNKSITLAQQLRLKLFEADVLGIRGYMLMALGNYPMSLESLLQALKITEDPASEKYTWNLPKERTPHSERLNTLGYNHLQMGHLYGATGNMETQIANYFTAMSLAESVQDSFLLSLANMNLGSNYFDLNKLDSALLFEQQALSFNSGGRYKGSILSTIGDIYLQKGNFNEALIMYQKSVQANTEQNNLTSLGGSYSDLSRLYEILQKPDSSLFYASLGLKNAKTIGQSQHMKWAYKRLSDVYSSQQNRDSTLKYLQLYTALNDSLNNVERQNLFDYQNIGFDEQIRLQKLEEEKIHMQTKIRTNTLAGGLFTLIVIAFFLYRNNRQKQKANALLKEQKEEVQSTLEKLESTQSQLIQSEKMASLGELTAGIAHEIQNPLNFVNNFSEVNKERLEEMNEEIEKGNLEEAKVIVKDIIENENKINHHGQRASAIVKGMLEHSRTSDGKKELTDINALADEYLRLAYHGLRAKDKSFNTDFKMHLDPELPKVNVVPQDIGRVLLNLINNAFYVVGKKAKAGIADYKPEVVVSTRRLDKIIEINVSDNGPGIPDGIRDKIFQPFFTTKPTGEGTGLGLSLSYDIVTKGHGGTIDVVSSKDKGSSFHIKIPTV